MTSEQVDGLAGFLQTRHHQRTCLDSPASPGFGSGAIIVSAGGFTFVFPDRNSSGETLHSEVSFLRNSSGDTAQSLIESCSPVVSTSFLLRRRSRCSPLAKPSTLARGKIFAPAGDALEGVAIGAVFAACSFPFASIPVGRCLSWHPPGAEFPLPPTRASADPNQCSSVGRARWS